MPKHVAGTDDRAGAGVLRYAASLFAITLFCSTAFAQNVARVAAFQDWSVFAADNICWVATVPISVETVSGDDAPAHHSSDLLMVTLWEDREDGGEISFAPAEPIPDGVDLPLQVGTLEFRLISQVGQAWTDTIPANDIMLDAMLSNPNDGIAMILRYEDTDPVFFRYSLLGLADALEDAKRRCA